MSLYTLNEKNAKKRPLLYEKKCMKVYLNDEKTPVDLRLLYVILLGLKNLCDSSRSNAHCFRGLQVIWQNTIVIKAEIKDYIGGDNILPHKQRLLLLPKSLYISCAMSNFYGTEIEIWAGFGLVGNTEKKLGQLWATFEGSFFMFSWAKKD